MEPEDNDVSLALGTLMEDLPKPVRDFLMSDERNAVARELSAKYSLHVDQAGEFETAYLHMLLGISTPEDFVSTLRNAGIDQAVINGLAADVNTRVFMRLREAERAATEAPSAPQRPAPLPPPALEYEPARAVTLPGSPIPAPMPVPVTPAPVVPQSVPAEEVASTVVPQAATPQQHMVHAMPQSAPQQGWHPAAAVHIFVPTHGPATQGSLPSQAYPVQQDVTPAQDYIVPQLAPVYTTPPASQLVYANPVPETLAPPPAMPIQKTGASDPYREQF